MTMQSIDQAARHSMSHHELKQACDELREAHFELQLCEKNLLVATKFMEDSHARLNEAIARMERTLQGLKHDS